MNEADIYEQLTEIFQDIFDDDTIVLTPETSAADIEKWDSFNHVNITVASEAAFGVRFKSSELEDLQSVGQLVRLIKAKQKR